MTIGPLLFAVRDRLRDVLLRSDSFSLSPESIDIMPDDRPKANCGQTFISIYAYSWSNIGLEAQQAMEEGMGVCCCISQRTPEHPQDRFGHVYADVTKSMSTLAYLIAASLHQWEGIHAAVDQYIADFEEITTDSANLHGLYEHLDWIETDSMPNKVGMDHFIALSPEDIARSYENMQSGFTMKVVFGNAKRMTPVSRLEELIT